MSKILPFVLPWWACVIIVALSSALIMGQMYVADKIISGRTGYDIACDVRPEINKKSEKVVLALMCGTHKLTSDDSDVLLSYIANPGPIACRIGQKANGQYTIIGCTKRT